MYTTDVYLKTYSAVLVPKIYIYKDLMSNASKIPRMHIAYSKIPIIWAYNGWLYLNSNYKKIWQHITYALQKNNSFKMFWFTVKNYKNSDNTYRTNEKKFKNKSFKLF